MASKKRPTKRAPKPAETDERYEYVRALIDAEGNLQWKYRLVGNKIEGHQAHDEDVSEWSEADIRDCTSQSLDVPEDQWDLIEIKYV